MKNTYEQLCTAYHEAIQPIWDLYTCDSDDCYDTFDGPMHVFMDSYALAEDIGHMLYDEHVSEEDKAPIKTFVELKSQFDKLECSSCFDSFFEEMSLTNAEKEEKWNQHCKKKIEVLKELLAATPPFVSAMYTYNGKTAPASV